MAKSRPSKARLFVALDLPAATRDQSARLLVADEALRPVPPQSLHVTVVFLGWQTDAQRVVELCGQAARGRGPVRLVPTGVRPVPRRSPRLVALDLEDPEGRSVELHASLASLLAGAGLYHPEKRPFWPHVTLARLRRGRSIGPLPRTRLPPPFEADRLVLYRSTLRPDGAVYEPLDGFTLET